MHLSTHTCAPPSYHSTLNTLPHSVQLAALSFLKTPSSRSDKSWMQMILGWFSFLILHVSFRQGKNLSPSPLKREAVTLQYDPSSQIHPGLRSQLKPIKLTELICRQSKDGPVFLTFLEIIYASLECTVYMLHMWMFNALNSVQIHKNRCSLWYRGTRF